MTATVKDGFAVRRKRGPSEGGRALRAPPSCGDGFTRLVPAESSAVRSAGQLVIPDWVGHVRRTEAALQNLKQQGNRAARCWLCTAFGYAVLETDSRAPSRTRGSWSPAVGAERCWRLQACVQPLAGLYKEVTSTVPQNRKVGVGSHAQSPNWLF